MLTSNKKRIVREVLSYYIDTTGLSEDIFILAIQRGRNKELYDLDYKDWLAIKSFELLKSHGISFVDCLDFRNLSKQKRRGKNGIYISELWKKEIVKEIESEISNDMLLLEMSDSVGSEFNYLSKKREFITLEVEGNKVNLLNTFDFDSVNRFLLNSLPEELRTAILENKEIFININPYLEDNTEISSLIEEMKMYGFNKKHLSNIYYKCLFRLIRLKEEYNLTNLKIGLYGPTSIFIDNKYKEFYNYFRESFNFCRGVYFTPKVIGVRTKEDYLCYTVWESKRYFRGKSVVLTKKVQHTDDTILQGGKKLMRSTGVGLYEWCDKTSKPNTEVVQEVPILRNISTISESKVIRNDNVLGYMLSSPNMFRLLKKVGLTNLPMGEYQEITDANFWQCVASYAVRVCLEEKIGLETLTLISPDTSIEGYTNWLADALILMLFNTSSMVNSYRQGDLRVENKLFPLSKKDVMRFISDENIINDMENSNSSNEYILERLKDVEQDLSEDAMKLYIFAKNKIKESLRGSSRAFIGYKNNLVAWDASLYQIRGMETVFTSKDEKNYLYLLEKLKDRLYDQVYNFGFILGASEIN